MPGENEKDVKHLLEKWERLSWLQKDMLLFRAYWIKYRSNHIYILAFFIVLFGRYLRGDDILNGHYGDLQTGLIQLILGFCFFYILIQLWRKTGLHNKLGDWPNLIVLIIGRLLYFNFELGVIRLLLIPPIILFIWIYAYVAYYFFVEKKTQSV